MTDSHRQLKTKMENILFEIEKINLKLGFAPALYGINYFRLMEYRLAFEHLEAKEGHVLLDAGSGYFNPFSLFLACQRKYTLHLIDKLPLTAKLESKKDKILRKLDLVFDEGCKRLVFRCMDIMKLKYPDNYFDRICCISTLEHIGNQPGDHLGNTNDLDAIKELARVLKKKGRLVVTVPFTRDHHIEKEEIDRENKFQRNYSYDSFIERIIKPSGLNFLKAVHFGERYTSFGKAYLKAPNILKCTLGIPMLLLSDSLWLKGKEYLGSFQPPDGDLNGNYYLRHGVICATLEK
ncbi:MAG: methyltransferase domain-containing protein [Candidatus Woesearchaeota archaeon]|nr:methyltransferase domain-containing protein [Candidatus Woesearchaeota archaeon]